MFLFEYYPWEVILSPDFPVCGPMNEYNYASQTKSIWALSILQADIVLEIPVVTLKPTIDEIQGAINKGTQIILSMSKDIPQWEHQLLHQRLQHKVRKENDSLCFVYF